jgi:hypothetical protein
MAQRERRVVVEPARERGGGPDVMVLVRYGLPAALVIAGLVCLLVVPSSARIEAWAGFTGAGISVLALSALFRFGATGDEERSREEAAREYYAKYGRWPDDTESSTGRKWTLPEGVVMPEDEESRRPS